MCGHLPGRRGSERGAVNGKCFTPLKKLYRLIEKMMVFYG
jgi:hypothetical protein